MNNEKKIWDFLMSRIGNEKGVAGLMGNLYAESALAPNLAEKARVVKLKMTSESYTQGVDSGSYKNFVRDGVGYGIAQWTFWTRKQRLLNYANSKRKSISDLQMQLEFLMDEIEQSYGVMFNNLKKATSVKEASNEVLFKYERPADQSLKVQQKRQQYSENIYNRNKKSGGGEKPMNNIDNKVAPIKRAKVKKVFMMNSPFYKMDRKLSVRGLMLHSVGCPQPKAMVFINQWNKPSFNRASVHAFIDANDGVVYQCMPWNRWAPHCGGAANNTHIGVEMCEPDAIKYVGGSRFTVDPKNRDKAIQMVKRTYETAVLLFAELCLVYCLDPLKGNAVISHREGHQRGLATNHGDPEHLWNNLGLPYSMKTFRQDVALAMKGQYEPTLTKKNQPAEPKGETPKKQEEQAPNAPSFKVRVKVAALNIRTGPGVEFPRTAIIQDMGVYTIIEEKNGWGRLKSGKGWINLFYTKKVAE